MTRAGNDSTGESFPLAPDSFPRWLSSERPLQVTCGLWPRSLCLLVTNTPSPATTLPPPHFPGHALCSQELRSCYIIPFLLTRVIFQSFWYIDNPSLFFWCGVFSSSLMCCITSLLSGVDNLLDIICNSHQRETIQHPSNEEWINTMGPLQTMEYDSAEKHRHRLQQDEPLKRTLNERREAQKVTNYITPLIQSIQNRPVYRERKQMSGSLGLE